MRRLICLSMTLPFAVAIAVNSAEAQFKTWRLADRPTVSIGSLDGDERYTFSSIISIMRMANGRIVVADRTPLIRIYDQAGKFVAQVGRRGEGPGEFQFLSTVFKYRGDSIAAADIAQRRISIFDANGKFGRSFQHSVTSPRVPGSIPAQSCCRVTMALPDGSFLVEPPEQLPNGPGGVRHGTLTILRVSADGSRVDTIAKVESRRLAYDPSAPNRIRDFHLSGMFYYTVIGDRMFGGNGEQNALQVFSTDGRKQPDLPLRQPRIAVTRAMQQAFEDTLRAAYARNPRMYEGPVESYLAGEFPEFLQAYYFVRSDLAGNLWLSSGRNPLTPPGIEYRVYSTSGAPLGEIKFKPGTAPYWFGRDEVIVIERDEFDVQYVRVYPLVK